MPSTRSGLSTAQAQKLLAEFGPNSIPEVPPPSNLSLLLSQLKSPLVYILLIAATVTIFLQHYSDAIIIGIAVAINTVLGFFQEKKASNALQALKKLVHPEVEVIRDGERQTIPSEQLVPEDICILKAGDKVPADGQLLEATKLFVSEAVLTGESVPVEKKVDDTVFMGTVVTAGTGLFQVTKTGANAEMGQIAQQVQTLNDDTPLKKQLVAFSHQLTILVVVLTAIVFVLGLILGRPLLEIFTTSVALAVSAIPEGLLIGLTVVLAVGMQRIVKRKGLVRNLVSAETLGGVSTICVDKTGTLTQGDMQVATVFGDQPAVAVQSLLANDRDDPLVIALWKWAHDNLTSKDLDDQSPEQFLESHPRIDAIPFTSEERFFASLHTHDDQSDMIYVNGAPEFIMEWCSLSAQQEKSITAEIEKLTGQGKRLIAMARKQVSTGIEELKPSQVKHDLEWVGLVGFSDPVRPGVKEALEKINQAQIRLIVITGDYAQTAVAVLDDLEMAINQDNIILGSELAKMSEDQLAQKLAESKLLLFARTKPLQKLKIVSALKQQQEVVAMMGDGVNDAPALKKADIGIVVGDATEVAKESAELVLLDSSFATIVAAIEEGRSLFNNLRKIILYLMSDAFQAIVLVLTTLVIGLPMPVTAAQILWINIVSDGFPHLSLSFDPKMPGIMTQKPRPLNEKLVTAWMRRLIMIVSIAGGLFALSVFIFFYTSSSEELARSITFAALGINSLVYVFSVKTLQEPFWKENPLDNKWLNLAVIAGVSFQLLPFSTPITRQFFGVVPLQLWHWGVVFSMAITMFVCIETSKWIFRRKLFTSN